MIFMSSSERALADIRQSLYGRLIRFPMAFFSARRVGDCLVACPATSLGSKIFCGTFPHMLRQIIFLTGGIALIAVTSWQLTLVMLCTIPPLIGIAILFGRKIRTVSKETQDRLADTNVIVEETLQGVATVKAFGNEAFEVGRYHLGLMDVLAVAVQGAKFRALFVAFIVFALFGGMVVVLWYGAKMVKDGSMTPGALTSFLIYTIFVAGALGSFAEIFATLQRALGATERVREIFEETPESLPDEMSRPTTTCHGNVQFDNVVFRYPSRADVPVLQGLSFEAQIRAENCASRPERRGKIHGRVVAAAFLRSGFWPCVDRWPRHS